jgi:hypothetical protein
VEYFKTDHFTDPANKSVTPFIDFDLIDEPGFGSPDASVGIPKDHFSVRWTGTVKRADTGDFNFDVDGDGAVKVLIDGKMTIDKSGPGRERATSLAHLESGMTHTVTIEYAHWTGNPALHVHWSGPGFARTVLTSQTVGWN